jgi:hypothetical protein
MDYIESLLIVYLYFLCLDFQCLVVSGDVMCMWAIIAKFLNLAVDIVARSLKSFLMNFVMEQKSMKSMKELIKMIFLPCFSFPLRVLFSRSLLSFYSDFPT